MIENPAAVNSIKYNRSSLRPAIGDPIDMIIDEKYTSNVAYFAVEEIEDDGSSFISPIGTVFFLEVRDHGTPEPVTYAITCSHVIDGARRYSRSYLQVNSRDGGFRNVPMDLDHWVQVPECDIAVSIARLAEDCKYWAIPITQAHGDRIHAGQRAFFVGLFQMRSGIHSVDAIVRSGYIARPNAKIQIDNGAEFLAHLVETRSWGGESGSPVFVDPEPTVIPGPRRDIWPQPWNLAGDVYVTVPTSTSHVTPPLLGVFHGHYQAESPIRRGQEPTGLSVDANSGIGIVIPISNVTNILRRADFVEERRKIAEFRKARRSRPPRPD